MDEYKWAKDAREGCIRGAIRNHDDAHDLNAREMERAVKIGVDIANASPGSTTWHQISNAAVAVVKGERG